MRDGTIIYFNSGTHPWEWLSNFATCEIISEGRIYSSVEHAYQAAKFEDPGLKERIRGCSTPGKAKRLAKKFKQKDNWYRIREGVMFVLLVQKFSKEPFRTRLIETGESILIHLSPWDDFWGNGEDNQGQNIMGKQLMEIRGKLGGPDGTH